jgi:hypothetical protein
VFHMNVTKVDRGVPYVAMVCTFYIASVCS